MLSCIAGNSNKDCEGTYDASLPSCKEFALPENTLLPNRLPLLSLPRSLSHDVSAYLPCDSLSEVRQSAAKAACRVPVPVLCRLPARSPARPCASDSVNHQTPPSGARRLGERPPGGTAQHQQAVKPSRAQTSSHNSPSHSHVKHIVLNIPGQGERRREQHLTSSPLSEQRLQKMGCCVLASVSRERAPAVEDGGMCSASFGTLHGS